MLPRKPLNTLRGIETLYASSLSSFPSGGSRKPLNTLRGIETDKHACKQDPGNVGIPRKPLNTLRGIETVSPLDLHQVEVEGLLLENPSTPSGVLKLYPTLSAMYW